MKKTGIRIALALILLLVMALGSVSTVEAGGRRVATATIGPHDDVGEGLKLKAAVTYENYRAYGVRSFWYKMDENGNYYEHHYVDKVYSSQLATSDSWDVTTRYTVQAGETWQLQVYLFKKNLSLAKKPIVVDTYQVQ